MSDDLWLSLPRVAATPKKDRPEPRPQEPMRAQIKGPRRNPSTDQKRVRRERARAMQRKGAAEPDLVEILLANHPTVTKMSRDDDGYMLTADGKLIEVGSHEDAVYAAYLQAGVALKDNWMVEFLRATGCARVRTYAAFRRGQGDLVTVHAERSLTSVQVEVLAAVLDQGPCTFVLNIGDGHIEEYVSDHDHARDLLRGRLFARAGAKDVDPPLWEPEPIFHGTTTYASDDILAGGFRLPDRPQHGQDYGVAVYFSVDRQAAQSYSRGKVIEARVRPGTRILDLTHLWTDGIIDHSYEQLKTPQIMEFVRRFDCKGMSDGYIVAIYDPSVIEIVNIKRANKGAADTDAEQSRQSIGTAIESAALIHSTPDAVIDLFTRTADWGEVKDYWDRSGDIPVWTQPRDELLRDALHSWKGDPMSIRTHIDLAINHAPQSDSGSGKIMRAWAEVLLDEIRSAPHVPVKLYRGEVMHSAPYVGERIEWLLRGAAPKRSVAKLFAKEDPYAHDAEIGVLRIITDTTGLHIADYNIGSGMDSIEDEYLLIGTYEVTAVDDTKKPIEATMRQVSTTTTHWAKTAELLTREMPGTVGDKSHITMEENGTVPTSAIAGLQGVMGETPGAHRNRQDNEWEQFKADIAANGITDPIFITVDWGDVPRISEGNHRRDAAVELGLAEVPVQVRYFGHAEQQGTLLERAGQPHKAAHTASVDIKIGDWILDAILEATAWENGKVVGAVEVAKPYYRIEKVYVRPSHRRRGIATQLVRALEAHLGRELPPGDELSPSGAAWASSYTGREYYDTWGKDGNWESWLDHLEADGKAVHKATRVVMYRGFGLALSPEVATALTEALSAGDMTRAGRVVLEWAGGTQAGYNNLGGVGEWWAQMRSASDYYGANIGNLYHDDTGYHFPTYEGSRVGVVLEGFPDDSAMPPDSGSRTYFPGAEVDVKAVHIWVRQGDEWSPHTEMRLPIEMRMQGAIKALPTFFHGTCFALPVGGFVEAPASADHPRGRATSPGREGGVTYADLYGDEHRADTNDLVFLTTSRSDASVFALIACDQEGLSTDEARVYRVEVDPSGSEESMGFTTDEHATNEFVAPYARVVEQIEGPELKHTGAIAPQLWDLDLDQLDTSNSYFLNLANPSTVSGWKVHIYCENTDDVRMAWSRIKGVVDADDLGAKLATARFFEFAGTGHGQHGKGVTIYFPRRATWEDDLSWIVDNMAGWPERLCKPIQGDTYVANGVSWRFDLSEDPGQDLSPERAREMYRSAAKGTYWRIHPPDRPFDAESASSTTFTGSDTREGYSSFANPWHLWLYLDAYRLYEQAKGQEVIEFSGQRVGDGNDGEDLVMPDMATVRRMPFAEFERELVSAPMPESPRFGPHSGPYGSWKQLAESWDANGWSAGDDPVVDKILARKQAQYDPSIEDGVLDDGTPVHFVSYGDAVPGGYNGGWLAMVDGKNVGYLDYQSGGGEVGIAMVEVESEWHRRGVARALLARLRAEFPGKEIDPGMMTPEGSAWWAKVANTAAMRWSEEAEDYQWFDIGVKVLYGKYTVKHWEEGLNWFIYDGDEYVGHMKLTPQLVADEVFIDPAYRREGLASAMLKVAQDYHHGRITFPGLDDLTPAGAAWSAANGRSSTPGEEPGAMWSWESMRTAAEDYRGQHQPPDDGPPLHDLTGGDSWLPDDVYDHPEYYVFGSGEPYERESIRVVRAVRGKPDAMVTIYRAAPAGSTINHGDWVAIAEGYAREHAKRGDPEGLTTAWHDADGEEHYAGDWPVLSASVPASTVRNGGNDLIEWGYWGPSIANVKVAIKEAAKEVSGIEHAMHIWRDSFGGSNMIAQAAVGEVTEEPYLSAAKAILGGIASAPVRRYVMRVDHRLPAVGDVIDIPLFSAAASAEEAAGYETFSNSFGLGEPRGIWYELLDLPALAFPDGREYICSGKFRVKNVRDWKPSWEGRPGSYVPLEGKRKMVSMEYVGPSSGVKLATKEAAVAARPVWPIGEPPRIINIFNPWDGASEEGDVSRPGYRFPLSYHIQLDEGAYWWMTMSHLSMTPMARGSAATLEEARAQVVASVGGLSSSGSRTASLRSDIEALRPELAAAVQKIVDEWEQSDEGFDEEYGYGGACDKAADAMAEVLGDHGIETTEGGADGDDHAWVVALRGEEVVGVDVPPGVYETGGGYSWTKLPDASISPKQVEVWDLDVPAENFREGAKTAMSWTLGPDDADRCTEAVLMQFGIFGRRPRAGLGVLEALMDNGWTYRAVEVDGEPFRGTVKQFYDRFKTGSYYFATSGHALSLIDGMLVDTAGQGPDGRRVIGAFEVWRKGEPQPSRMHQSDPHTAAQNWESGRWFHGTNIELQLGDAIVPGLGAVHGNDNDRVWVASNAWVASAYGSITYEVEPSEHPKRRNKAGEFYCSGAKVLRRLDAPEIIEAGNQWWEQTSKHAKLAKTLDEAIEELAETIVNAPPSSSPGYSIWGERPPRVDPDWAKTLSKVKTIYRGYGLKVSEDEYSMIFGENSWSSQAKAEHLLELISKRGLGTHWTTHRGEAAGFAGMVADKGEVRVIVEANPPAPTDVLTGEGTQGLGIQAWDDTYGEQEIPIRQGAQITVKGVQWAPGGPKPLLRSDDGGGWTVGNVSAVKVAIVKEAGAWYHEAESIYKRENGLAPFGPAEDKATLETLLQSILTDASIPHGDDAYIWPYEKQGGSSTSSCIGWDNSEELMIPVVFLGADMFDPITICHEAAHHIDHHQRGIVGRPFTDTDEAHAGGWASIFLGILTTHYPKAATYLTEAFATKAAKVATKFEPGQMSSWETTKPWNLSESDAEAQRVPGWWAKSARGSESASWEQGYIRPSPEFFHHPEEARRAIAYHEAGHAMLEAAGGLTSLQDPLSIVELPGAEILGHNAEEIIAEGYSVLWCEPVWFDRVGARAVRDLTIDIAKRAGFPLPSISRAALMHTAALAVPVVNWKPEANGHGGTGIVSSDHGPVICYRGFGSWGEAKDSLQRGEWISSGMFTVRGEGDTQMALDLQDVLDSAGVHRLRGTGFLGYIEADISGLPFATFRTIDTEPNNPTFGSFEPDTGLGIGIVGGIPLDRIRKVVAINDDGTQTAMSVQGLRNSIDQLKEREGWEPQVKYLPETHRIVIIWKKGDKRYHHATSNQDGAECGWQLGYSTETALVRQGDLMNRPPRGRIKNMWWGSLIEALPAQPCDQCFSWARNRAAAKHTKVDSLAMAVPNFKGTERNMSQRQFLSACQKILKDIAREYGVTGELPEIEFAQPGDLGSALARSIDITDRNRDLWPNGAILLDPDLVERARDKEYGYSQFRIVAHEVIHAMIQREEPSYPGYSQMITEGGAEVLSVAYWAKNAPAFDDRDAVRIDGKWVPGDIALVRDMNYKEWVQELMLRAASKVGWNADAILREVQRIVAGNTTVKLDFRDSTNTNVTSPTGDSSAEGLMLWLISQLVREPHSRYGALSLEALISVAEETMERGGLAGKTLHIPTGHVDDPTHQAALAPYVQMVSEWCGRPVRFYANDYILDTDGGGAQAMTDGHNTIVVRPTTTEMTILHEAAHVILHESESYGHTPEFVTTAEALYREHLGDVAADQFMLIVGDYI